MARVLVAAGVGYGQLQPHLAVAHELARRGRRVWVYAEPEAAGAVKDAGCGFLPAPGGLHRAMLRCRTTAQLVALLRRAAAAEATQVLEWVRAERVTHLLVNATALGPALAAERSGLPWASLATTPALLHRSMRRAAHALVALGAVRRKLGLPRTERDSARQALSPALYLLPWPELFDAGPPPPQAFHVGPLAWDPPRGAAPAWLRAGLKGRRPLVLVGSTTSSLDVGAEATTHYLDVCISALNQLEVFAVVTTCGARVTARAAPHVKVVESLPHHWVVPHATVVVTHAGWGTLGRALRHAVPTVLVPGALDQPLNARLAVQAGTAVRLSSERLTPGQMARALERLASARAPERKRARALAARLARLEGAAGAAKRLLQL